MKPWLDVDGVTVFHGDCIEVMRQLPDNSVHAVVTDPPYGLEFMGKEWDSFSPVDLDRGGRWTKDKRQGAGRIDDDTGNKYGRVAYGANRSFTSECQNCGKRDAFRNPHSCADLAKWIKVVVDQGPPPQMVAFGEWSRQWCFEAYRVLKPGGHLLAFGGTRTWHRLAVAIEDAGFEVRDNVAYLHDGGLPGPMCWAYGSGFPKSLDVSKAIDKRAGAERETKRIAYSTNVMQQGIGVERPWMKAAAEAGFHELAGDIPATPAAEQWQGWGTALKPAHEPIVVARKPLIGTVAENVLTHGTGALNIDGCRIETTDNRSRPPRTPNQTYGNGAGTNLTASESHHAGRWPANVILDESQAAELDKQSGVSSSPSGKQNYKRPENHSWASQKGMWTAGREWDADGYGDSGGASRFFYVAKASKKERPNVNGIAHPTVKPMALMRYLVRLVTPPGGTVLEPFAGSGTTIEACVIEGFHCIAIEREADYLPLIEARLSRPIQGAM